MFCLKTVGEKVQNAKLGECAHRRPIHDDYGYDICCNDCGKQTALMCHVIKHTEQVHINLCSMNKSIFTHILIGRRS